MKILHAADFHLDSPFGHLSAGQAMARRRELRELPRRLTELAKAEGAELILLPGDLFDGERVCPETVSAMKDAFGGAGVPVVIAPGNHDHLRPGSPYLAGDWPENVHIFTENKLTAVEFPALKCVVHGCAFTAPHREDAPLDGFCAPEDGRLHLLCIHGEVCAAGRYAPLPESDLRRSGVAYAALGHIHAPSGLRWAGDTPWAYSGCAEGRGFDESGERGAMVVTVGDGGVSAEFFPLCRRQYRIESADVGEFEALLNTLPGEDLVRIILTGECDRAPDLAALQAKAEERLFYAEVRDETTLPRDLWARAGEDSLTGLFLREMGQRLEGASGEERGELLLALRFGLAALERGEDVCP